MEYPQYRKYINIETYFIIHSAKTFEEYKVLGKKYFITKVEAVQYPEQLLIQDMLAKRDERWETISELDFLTKIEEIKTSKIKVG